MSYIKKDVFLKMIEGFLDKIDKRFDELHNELQDELIRLQLQSTSEPKGADDISEQ